MQNQDKKYIFVTGGVLSGLGKGLVAASIGKLLELRNQKITPVKCDGYLNVDPGTMNPHEHGEVFVLEDGTEVDMDFGHYERFLGIKSTGEQNLTSGKIFKEVIEKERKGDYLGKTVQMVPHVTNLIQEKITKTPKDTDVVIVEIGGTVGDIENQLYLETIRQLTSKLPENQTFHVHATLIPFLETTGEQKTKPTQHSVKELRETGLKPDMIIGRTKDKLEKEAKEKIALFCDVEKRSVISDPNINNIYKLPLLFDKQNVDHIIAEKMGLPERKDNLDDWKKRVKNLDRKSIAKIALTGKYTEMEDSYASIEEAIKHAGAEIGGQVTVEQVPTDDENFNIEVLDKYDGVIIPGGFGKRGVEGKIRVAQYCRENKKPLLGICYGMQLMTIEFARNVLGIENASSEEFGNKEDKFLVKEMQGQKNIEEKGGTMRLGGYDAKITGKVKEIYGKELISERHRHRFEINPQYVKELEKDGLKITGYNPGTNLPEFIELDGEHPFYIGTQAHPEFNSSFENPNPLYLEFLRSTQ